MDNLRFLESARMLMEPWEDPELWLGTNVSVWNALRYGPVPAPEAIDRIQAEASAFETLGGGVLFIGPLIAMQGRFEEARAMVAKARADLLERGLMRAVGASSLGFAHVEMSAGAFDAAERDLASGVSILRGMGETGVLSTLSAMRASALYRLGRREEMEAAISLAREKGAPNDIATQVEWRCAAAMAAADDGRMDQAAELINEALEKVEPTDFLGLRAEAFQALAHVEARAGRVEGWRSALERALAEHERKGNLVDGKRIRDLMSSRPPTALA
jgi:tetratricopeptide (TPR) repeat protein